MLLIKQFFILCMAAAVIVAAVRFLLISGLDTVCASLRWSAKVKGQLIGYATSLPELVVIVTSAWAGVFSAGFWNIASSNIINCTLFLAAIIFYRQLGELKSARFLDELTFTILSVVLPIAMYSLHLAHNFHTVLILFGVFAAYKWLDIVFNPKPQPAAEKNGSRTQAGRTLISGIPMLLAGILLIMLAGRFLSRAAESLVLQLSIPGWLIGWLLGVITSIPEMASFFEIYRVEKKRGDATTLRDTQQALDALVSSNLCNLGIILPIGLLIYLLIT
jgi:Ca2+/Na+ antiporter